MEIFNECLLDAFRRYRDAGASVTPAFLKEIAAQALISLDHEDFKPNSRNPSSSKGLTFIDFVTQTSFIQRWRIVSFGDVGNLI